MRRLIKSELAAAGQLDGGPDSPSLLLDLRTTHVLGLEQLDLGGQVLAHEVEYRSQLAMAAVLPVGFIGRMDAGFRRGQLEDQPTASGVHGRELENDAKARAIGLGIVAVEKDVSAGEHGELIASRICRRTAVRLPRHTGSCSGGCYCRQGPSSGSIRLEQDGSRCAWIAQRQCLLPWSSQTRLGNQR